MATKTLRIVACAAAWLTATAAASDIELPGQIAWTAYGTGSAGYNQSVAIGAALAPPDPPCSTSTANATCGSSAGAKPANQPCERSRYQALDDSSERPFLLTT